MIVTFEAGRKWNKYKAFIYHSLLFKGISISYDWLNPKNISFIGTLTNLRGLTIESTKSFDLSPIQGCKYLAYLNLGCGVSTKTRLDLSRLSLERYLGSDKGDLSTIYSCTTLKYLTLSSPKIINFKDTNLKNLKDLVIDGSTTLETLEGLGNIESLKRIEIIRCPKLDRSHSSVVELSKRVKLDIF